MPPVYTTPLLRSDSSLSAEHVEWFRSRGIGREVLERNRVCTATEYSPADKAFVSAVAFPYYRDQKLVNVKYRKLPKTFWQVKGAEKIVYGFDDVVRSSEVIIVEGEMDKLSFNQAGIWNVISVPDGAPAKVKSVEGDGPVPEFDQEKDVKFSYVWQCKQLFENKMRIVLATDNDAPGAALAEELARRLGKERCWHVRWPRAPAHPPGAAHAADVTVSTGDNLNRNKRELSVEPALVSASSGSGAGAGAGAGPAVFCKDANDVLLQKGAAALHQLVADAEPTPINGLYRFRDYYDEIQQYYINAGDKDLGVSTGWASLDEYYKVVPGELTIVTGIPNSGKSEWIDALLTNIAQSRHWCFALCSLEKRPRDHAKQLLEKHIGKPFFNYIGAVDSKPRMTMPELRAGLEFLEEHFHVIKHVKEEPPTVEWVLEVARMAVMRYGIRGLVIDPYNELDHSRPAFMNETEYISHMLSKVKRFAQMYDVHVWFVAHPRQMQNWHGQPPTLYDISGSANFINKADNGIVVHRQWDTGKLHQQPQLQKGSGSSSPVPVLKPSEVQILVRKVRNKAAGRVGTAVLEYERSSGRYKDPNDRNVKPIDAEAQTIHRSPTPGHAAGAGEQESGSNGSDGDPHGNGDVSADEMMRKAWEEKQTERIWGEDVYIPAQPLTQPPDARSMMAVDLEDGEETFDSINRKSEQIAGGGGGSEGSWSH